MPSISSGVGSGLDVQSIVDQLVNADITPARNRIALKQSSYTTQLSSIGQIKGVLSKLQTTMTKLSDLQQFYALKTTVSDNSVLTAIASNTASAGTYQVEVLNVAASQSLASGAFADTSTVIGSGSITIDFGTYNQDLSAFTANPDMTSLTINIAPGEGTLDAIKNAINDSSSGVKAAIVQDSQGARLTITSPQTGVDYAMKISVSDDDANNTDNSGLSSLAYDPTTAVNNLTQTIAASDSNIKINGLSLTQSNNQYDKAISGVTLNLIKAQPGTSISVIVAENKDQAKNLINEFITQYNETMKVLNSLTGYNAATKQGGLLQGDPAIRNLKFNLTQLIGESVKNLNSNYKSLTDIGIKTDSNGLLTLDSTTLSEALDNNYEEVGALFAKSAKATDSNVRINSFNANIKAGSYNLILDTYVPGSSLSGTLGGIAATSTDGKTLTGTGNFSGLSVDILGGSTGYRGNVTISDGAAVLLNNLISSYLGSDGVIESKTDSLNDKIKDLDNQQVKLQDHADQLHRRYLAQFTRLDALLSSLQSVSDSLTQSLSNLQKFNSSRG